MRALILLVLVFLASPAQAFEDELLDHFVGDWVMRGTIGGNEIVHDVHAEWILAHHYLRFTDVSRERDENGERAYEALVLIGWEDPTENYSCLWLDVTGGEGLTNGIIGRAPREGDAIPFVFPTGEETAIHNTFTYQREAGVWHWVIDIVRDGEASNFADVTLSRRDSRAELIALHESSLQAHLEKNAAALVDPMSPDYLTVSNGEARYRAPAEMLEMFEGYLASTEFSRYEDSAEPIVGFSDDGSMAWVIAQVRVAGDRSGEKFDTQWAWMTIFSREDGAWVRVADVSTAREAGSGE